MLEPVGKPCEFWPLADGDASRDGLGVDVSPTTFFSVSSSKTAGSSVLAFQPPPEENIITSGRFFEPPRVLGHPRDSQNAPRMMGTLHFTTRTRNKIGRRMFLIAIATRRLTMLFLT